jgi:hypothetical protein
MKKGFLYVFIAIMLGIALGMMAPESGAMY